MLRRAMMYIELRTEHNDNVRSPHKATADHVNSDLVVPKDPPIRIPIQYHWIPINSIRRV